MNAGEALRTGWRELATHKTRSVLSFAAVAVGVASLLYTFAQIQGMRENLAQAVELIGPGRISIQEKQGYVSKGLSKGLSSGDAEEIRRRLPGLHMVYAKARNWNARLTYGGSKIEGVGVEGVEPDWRKRDWVYRRRGRFLNDWDLREGARVCVLIEPGGWVRKPFWASFYMREDPYDDFVGRRDLVGRTLMLEDHVFTVVGALKQPPRDKDPRWFSWETPQVLVPLTTYQRYLRPAWAGENPREAVDKIEVDTGDERTVASVKRKLEALLSARHRGEGDFELEDMREAIQGELNETQQYVVAGIALGIVALLAGGIGIMNVTLAALFSRVKEIGIRRALGAARLDILAQFLAEAVFLGLAGGGAGILLGLGGVTYLSAHSRKDVGHLTWLHCLGALLIAAGVSAVFSLYPAWQASRLDPVEALKAE